MVVVVVVEVAGLEEAVEKQVEKTKKVDPALFHFLRPSSVDLETNRSPSF